jgi:hypothetical protein
MSTNNKAKHDLTSDSRRLGSSPAQGNAPTTGTVLRRDVAQGCQPPPWEVVELCMLTGEQREWIDAYAGALPSFAADVTLRRQTERPPWRLVERYLAAGEHAAWVEWYAHARPAFADLIRARCRKEAPPWELVDECLRSGEYAEWVEDYVQSSPAFGRTLLAMRDPDDADDAPPSFGRVIPMRPRRGSI